MKYVQVQGQELPFCGPPDLPRIVLRTFNLDSSPTNIDFHPIEQSLLLGQYQIACNVLCICSVLILYVELAVFSSGELEKLCRFSSCKA